MAEWGRFELAVYGGPLLVVTLILVAQGTPWAWAAVVPGVLLAMLAFFFRDPYREIPRDADAFVAPADGRVVEVGHVDHYDFFGGPAVRIGIFLSLLDVHVNRVPRDGRVVETHYQKGEFLNAMRSASAERNEFLWTGLEEREPPHRRFAVRQVAGMLANRIVSELEPGRAVQRGERFGMIKFGSRTELILPAEEVTVLARVGQSVRGGSTILARRRD